VVTPTGRCFAALYAPGMSMQHRKVCPWHHSIRITFIFAHVIFESGLSISVSRNREPTDRKLKWEIENLQFSMPDSRLENWHTQYDMHPTEFSNPALATRLTFPQFFYSLFLLCFFITFNFPPTLPSHNERQRS
jgi:hypothetical protein